MSPCTYASKLSPPGQKDFQAPLRPVKESATSLPRNVRNKWQLFPHWWRLVQTPKAFEEEEAQNLRLHRAAKVFCPIYQARVLSHVYFSCASKSFEETIAGNQHWITTGKSYVALTQKTRSSTSSSSTTTTTAQLHTCHLIRCAVCMYLCMDFSTLHSRYTSLQRMLGPLYSSRWPCSAWNEVTGYQSVTSHWHWGFSSLM